MQKFWLWLATRKGLSPRGAARAASCFPSVEALYYADAAAYEAAGLKNYQPLLEKDLWLPTEILRRCYDLGISLLTWQDAAYPQLLRSLEDPPVVLYYRGLLPDFSGLSIAVVGTRGASAYGLAQARHLGYGLGRCGCTLVSGGAKGIDTAALEGALTGGGPVVCVLGGGVDVVYPASNRSLFQDVAQRGCLLSEYPPGTRPKPEHFPVRNRIISGLCQGVVVVEAPEKSGALITAQLALDQGRDVFAVPGNVDAACSAGSNGLLREGAIVAQSGWDVMEEYQSLFPEKVGPWSGKTLLSSYPRELAELREPPYHFAQETPINSEKNVDNEDGKPYSELQELMSTLSDDERAVTSCLTDALRHVDDVIAGSGLPAARVLASLTLLEVKGLVVRHPGKFYSLARRGAGEW